MSAAVLRPRPYAVAVAHVPREPIWRVEHRLGVLKRARDLSWHTLVCGLEADVVKAAPSLTRGQRDALIEWLRWEEWHFRVCGQGGSLEAHVLAACRKHLRDADAVTADTTPHMMRPFAHVVDLQWERTRRKQTAARGVGKA